MSASKLLVYRMPASRTQIRITSGVALALFVLFAAPLFFRTHVLRTDEAFVPITGAMLVMADWITATLLFSQALVLRARPLRTLAAGYFFAGLFVLLRVLALPGILVPAGPFDPNYNMPYWFYLASHAMLPLAIMAYAWPSGATGPRASNWSRGHYLAGSVILAGTLIIAAVISETSLTWTSPLFLPTSVMLLFSFGALVMLAFKVHSVLDLWLLLVLWGWFLELALLVLASKLYTAGWYAARSLGLLSGLFVLFALLAETSKLYAQTVLQLAAQKQERLHRTLIRDAITASFAHELRQPLCAILLNAQASRKGLASPRNGGGPVAPGEFISALDDIIASSKRADAIIASSRTIFGQESSKKRLADMGMLLRATLAMVAGSARAQDVSVKLTVEGHPKLVAVNRLQMQQALLNLFQNAIEAFGRSSQPNRTLRVRCMPSRDPVAGPGVTIRIEDNGPGIAPADRERIFDVFFTTRAGATGLGLAIARTVIEAHGGRLDVEPSSPAGTAFVIHLH